MAQNAPLRASGTDFQAIPGSAQFQVRTPETLLACSINAGATRFGRYSVYVPSSTSLAKSARPSSTSLDFA
eukprot:4641561-Alexandrium_andersonii.AAC.1